MNIQNLVRENIKNLTPYSSARDEFSADAGVFLDANENPFGTLNRYPDSTQQKLREKLSEIYDLSYSQIVVGNGSDELIDLIIKIFCEPNKDAVVTLNPSFAMYDFYAQVNGNTSIKLNLDEHFQLTREEFLNKTQASKAKVLFLCSPNNPTGNSLQDIEFFVKSFNGIVVVDEAYQEFSSQQSMASLLPNTPNLIVLRTLSKAYGLAGARVGYAVASEEIISLFLKVKSPYNVSAINMEAALEQLENKEELQQQVQILLEERKRLEDEFKSISIIKKVYPTDANFFLIEFSEVEKVYEILLENEVLTSKRFPAIPSCLRINMGSSVENQKLITLLRSI